MDDEGSPDGLVLPDDTATRSVVRYFRECPDRVFAILGGIVFVAGWVAAIRLAFFANVGPTGSAGDAFTIQILVSLGASVTTAAAVLWGVAAYLWVHLLPDDAAA